MNIAIESWVEGRLVSESTSACSCSKSHMICRNVIGLDLVEDVISREIMERQWGKLARPLSRAIHFIRSGNASHIIGMLDGSTDYFSSGREWCPLGKFGG